MCMGIFSSFDDQNRVLFNLYHLMWLSCLGMIMVTNRSYFIYSPSYRAIYFKTLDTVSDLICRTQSKNLGGSASMVTSVFIILVTLNLTGLLPYVFSLTSHLAFNLALSMPIWLSVVLSGILFNFQAFIAHLQPAGAPAALNPFLCVVELVSLMVRPLTLAVRLTANLSTGHILMALLGTSFVSSSSIMALLIVGVGLFYFSFEMAVCLIQGYIFTLLPTLYLDEHPANN